MPRIRLGIIGTGLMFQRKHLAVLLKLQHCYQMVALCNRSPAKAEAVAATLQSKVDIYEDYRELLSRTDVDAVLVCVPIHLNARLTQAALGSGKHVFVEKPIADNVADGEESLRLARAKGLTLMVGENFRYRPKFRQVRRLVSEGVIGQPKLFRLNDLHYTDEDVVWSQTAWRREPQHVGGYILDGGPHIIAGMREMVGSRVRSVHGLSTSFDTQRDWNGPDTLVLHLSFENGMVGQVALGNRAVDEQSRRAKIYGDKGTIILNGNVIEVCPVDRTLHKRIVTVEKAEDEFTDEWLDFHAAITEGKKPQSSAEEALEDLRVLDAGLRSASTHQVIVM